MYLKPFEACFKEGGAHGVMASYNSLSSGLPAHADPWLLTKVLREDWGVVEGEGVDNHLREIARLEQKKR